MAYGDTALLTERSDQALGDARPGGASVDTPAGGGPAGGALDDALPGDVTLPDGLVASLKSFATEHQGAKAIIEYVGRRGARIVLVGGDESWGDQFAPSTDVARQACAVAGVPVENSWERELIEQMGPAKNLWRSMSRRTLAR